MTLDPALEAYLTKRASELLAGGNAILTVLDELRAGQHRQETCDDGFITVKGKTNDTI